MTHLYVTGVFGPCDGVNTDFETPVDYVAGSLRVWRNGNFVTPGGIDGWTETGARSFRMNEPPHLGDRLDAAYIPR